MKFRELTDRITELMSRKESVSIVEGLDIMNLDIRQDFVGADFSGCDCRGVDFTGANLTGCSFENADLTGCHFDGADLSGARFHNATFSNDAFSNADTSQTLGLNPESKERLQEFLHHVEAALYNPEKIRSSTLAMRVFVSNIQRRLGPDPNSHVQSALRSVQSRCASILLETELEPLDTENLRRLVEELSKEILTLPRLEELLVD